MWPFSRVSARRLEIRRSKAEWARAVGSRLAGEGRLSALGVALISAIAASAILNFGGQSLALREGQSLNRAAASRVAFQIADPQQTDEMRFRARDASPNYYLLDVSLLDDVRGRLGHALTLAKVHPDDPAALIAAAASKLVRLDEPAARELLRIAGEARESEFERQLATAMAALAATPLVPAEDASLRRTASRAVLVDPRGDERVINMSQLVFISNPEAAERLIADVAATFSPDLRKSMSDSLLAILRGRIEGAPPAALYRGDADRTLAEAAAAEAAVPPQVRRFGVNEILAPAGPLREDSLALLQAEHAAYRAKLADDGAPEIWFEWIGRSALVVLVVFGVTLYLRSFQRVQFGGATQIARRVIASSILLALLALTRFAFVGSELPPHAAVGTQSLAAAMLAIVYPPGIVLSVTSGLALLATMAVQQNVSFFVLLMLVSGTFVFGLRDVRNRGRIVMIGCVAALVAAVGSLCGAMTSGQTLALALYQSAWAAGGTLFASFVIEGVLPGIERVFLLSSGMTLLEWCDANKPLLRLMAVEAPGTYNHSLLVGALAESAAESIGANGLLARSGSYYHDIGKINKPEYFVENQVAGINRHERLSPAMSLLIIVGHVKDGIEMAREYKLPASLIPFIAEHHGTTLVEYFYHAANKQRKPDDAEVSETEFRYPGPKPQSRETAIVMLADGVEGAVRAMSEPTPGRIEAVVSEVVRRRLMDGQFDECELSFRELAEIEKSLIKSLCGIYHARVAYPESDEAERAGAARSAS